MLAKSIVNFSDRLKVSIEKTGPVEKRPSKTQVVFWIGIVIIMVQLSVSNFQAYQLGTHYDDSKYVVLAQSLIHSNTYGMVNNPGEPAPGKYPFGYPLVLVPMLVLFPGNLPALNIPSLIATILTASIFFWGWPWFFKQKSYWWGVAITGLYAFSPMVIDHSRRVMSEPVFIFFCLAGILLTEQYVRGKRVRFWPLWMSLSLIFTIYSRSIGIVLAVSCIGFLFFIERKAFITDFFKTFLISVAILGILVALTPIQFKDLLPAEYMKDENARFLSSLVSGNPTTEAEIGLPTGEENNPAAPPVGNSEPISFTELIRYGIHQHFGKDLRAVALPIGGGTHEQELANRIGLPFIPSATGYLVSAIIILGFFRLFRQNPTSFFLWFAVVYFMAIFMWIWNDPRLLYPILPQIMFGLLTGMERIVAGFFWLFHRWIKSSRAQSVIIAMVVAVLLGAFTVKSFQIDDSRLHAGDLEKRSSWIKTNSSPTAIIMSEAPETDFLYSGRKSIYFPASVTNINQLLDYVHLNRVDFVLVAPQILWETSYQPIYSDQTKLILGMLDDPGLNAQIKMVYSSEPDKIRVYQVNP